MIRFDFNYKNPETILEAVEIMSDCIESNKEAIYYAGGTELLTNFRNGKVHTDLVIDIKNIKPLNTLKYDKDTLVIGAAVSLSKIIEESNITPLNEVLRKIADHTTRNSLTLGGNICGRLPYREAILPLLALNATAVIATINGISEKPLREVFDKRLKLKHGELLVQINVEYNSQNYFAKRITEGTDIDYPIFHLFATKEDDIWNIALSGYGAYPIFESIQIKEKENTLNIINSVFKEQARKCSRASKEYRQHLLYCTLEEMIKGGELSGK